MRHFLLTSMVVCAVLAWTAPSSADNVSKLLVKQDKQGAHVVDSSGRALYIFTADKQGKGAQKAESNCKNECASTWPPLVNPQAPKAGDGIDAGKIGVIDRRGGPKQVTYNGWPLYRYLKDRDPKAEGQGEGEKGSGGEWYLLTPAGEPLKSEAAAAKKS